MYISEDAIQDKRNSNELNIWYDRNPICSYNALLSFALGARGTGKTYAFKKWAMKSDKPFVWIRRLQEDIDKLCVNNASKFTMDLYQNGVLQPDDEVKLEGRTLYVNDMPKIYFVALSLSTRTKSLSYGDVDIMVFDEVFEGIGNKSYLKDEVTLFFDLYETINRLRIDGRPEVRCYFLSNKTTFTNPYFSYFNIQPFEGRFKTFNNGLIVVENYKNEEFAKKKRESRFGQLISETRYGKYAIENEVWLDDNAFLEKKPPKSKPIVQIRYKEQYISIWNGLNGLIYCDNCKSGAMKFSIKYECKDDEYALVIGKYPLKQMKELFEAGKLRFDNNITKSIVFTLLQTAGQS